MAIFKHWLGGVRLSIDLPDAFLGTQPVPPRDMPDTETLPAFAELELKWAPTAAGSVTRCDLSEVGPRRFVAQVEADTPRAATSAAHDALCVRMGALTLHASVSVLGAGAVAFVGPSGAGKSTASRLLDTPVIARDRAVVVLGGAPVLPAAESSTTPPPEGQAWVYSLWPREPFEAYSEPATFRSAPLVGVLRVRQGQGQPALRRLEPAAGVFTLLENASGKGPDGLAQDALLEVLARLTEHVFVGEVETVLGHSLAELLAPLAVKC